MTMIARVVDGLPLAATMQEDEQVISFYCLDTIKTYYFPRVTCTLPLNGCIIFIGSCNAVFLVLVCFHVPTSFPTRFYLVLSSLLFFFYNLICCGGSQSGCNVLEYQNQAKMLFRKLGPQSPTRCSIETGPYLFQ